MPHGKRRQQCLAGFFHPCTFPCREPSLLPPSDRRRHATNETARRRDRSEEEKPTENTTSPPQPRDKDKVKSPVEKSGGDLLMDDGYPFLFSLRLHFFQANSSSKTFASCTFLASNPSRLRVLQNIGEYGLNVLLDKMTCLLSSALEAEPVISKRVRI